MSAPSDLMRRARNGRGVLIVNVAEVQALRRELGDKRAAVFLCDLADRYSRTIVIVGGAHRYRIGVAA